MSLGELLKLSHARTSLTVLWLVFEPASLCYKGCLLKLIGGDASSFRDYSIRVLFNSSVPGFDLHFFSNNVYLYFYRLQVFQRSLCTWWTRHVTWVPSHSCLTCSTRAQFYTKQSCLSSSSWTRFVLTLCYEINILVVFSFKTFMNKKW